ncbi:MAG: NAD-dependent epimerase/dehydratase family protein [Alphaproteobacteria bacterium]|jgi:UDP-glucuronate 4-epimerase|nr:GDP-mannose 4,6-dehydratase [Candidatus Jidaibacter sp.]
MRILVTGAAGFIGFTLSKFLLENRFYVIGIDNIHDYYSAALKKDRLSILEKHQNFEFNQIDLADYESVSSLFTCADFDMIIHLAAQPGVRYSIINPSAYIKNNIDAYLNILECAKTLKTLKHIVYASSSSVYGANTKLPYSESDTISKPNSLYATTKITNELMSENYHHIYGLNFVGLRFFTVYGPWGRPDMAPFIFTKNIIEGKEIQLFNHGNLKRDFTYVDDIVAGIVGAINHSPAGNEIYNLGNNEPVALLEFVETLSDAIGKKPIIKLVEMQKGDVYETYAEITKAQQAFGFEPKTNLKTGLKSFVEWYKSYYS